jgi:hypothetical protein
MGRVVLLALALALGVTAERAAAPPLQEIRVFAASSLSAAFGDLANRFEHAHPGVTVRLNLAGSQPRSNRGRRPTCSRARICDGWTICARSRCSKATRRRSRATG